jgi:serine/threonine protein kinase
MKAERWRQIDLLLQSTLEQPAERRRAFLVQACDGDEELLVEVSSLLDHHQQAGNTFEGLPGVVAAEMLDHSSFRISPGQHLGHYQIVSLLGAGGMGEVYLAKDDSLGRLVALKILPERFTQSLKRVLRFEQEARAASGLNHPNIVTIHQIGEVDGTHFMVTEFIEGQTLRRRMMVGRMSPAEALDVAMQVANALESAHAAAIIHRDIKPENIMLRPDGLIKVLDFGLAKLAEREQTRTHYGDPIPADLASHDGVVMGSAQYMSPEQARGHKMDSRTDIFSLGVVLYEMVTGHAPFTGPTIAAVLAAVITEEPLPLAHYVPAIPIELERIVRNAIAKELEDRYASTREMYRDLKQLDQEMKLQEKLAELPPAGMSRRHAIWLAGATIATATLSGLGAWKLWPKKPEVQHLAVIPFTNNGNEASKRISDFISNALIDRLSPIPSLKVTPRTDVSDFKQGNKDIRDAGHRLNVAFVLTGSVSVQDERLSINAKLQDAITGEVIKPEYYYDLVPLGDAYRIQKEIASRVVDLDIFKSLSNFERNQFATLQVKREALDLYRRGRRQLQLDNEFGGEKARSLWQSAIELDDKFALALCGVGSTYAALALAGREPPDVASSFLKQFDQVAGWPDQIIPDVYCLSGAKAFFFDWDWEKARVQYAKITQPADPLSYSSCLASLRALGDTNGALKLVEKLNGIDPNQEFKLVRAELLVSNQEFREALDIYNNMISDYPSDSRAYSGMEEAFRVQGQFNNAIEARRKALGTAGPYSVPDSFRDLVSNAQGKEGYRKIAHASAELELRDLNSRDAGYDYVSPVDFARAYAQLGDKDNAIKYLNDGLDEKSPGLVFLNVDPVWDTMRGDSRFRAVVRKMNFPAR